jgi:hypothetical protein
MESAYFSINYCVKLFSFNAEGKVLFISQPSPPPGRAELHITLVLQFTDCKILGGSSPEVYLFLSKSSLT